METRGLLSRVGGLLACQPDLLAKLKADKPQDPRANEMCRTDRLAKDYIMAASDSTVAAIRPYAGSPPRSWMGGPMTSLSRCVFSMFLMLS